MIRRSTWILIVLFLLVLAAAWGFQRYKSQQAAEATPTASTEQLLDIQENTLASLRIENNQGQALVLGRNAEGLWTVTEPVGEGETDTAQVASAISQLISLRSQFTLEMPENLGNYGLLQPSYTVTLALNGGEKHVLLIGSEARAVSGYYIQLDGAAPRVVSKFSLDPVLEMLKKPPYTATDTPIPDPTGTPGTPLPEDGAAPAGETPTVPPAASTPTPTP
jgi:hypothetical protein